MHKIGLQRLLSKPPMIVQSSQENVAIVIPVTTTGGD